MRQGFKRRKERTTTSPSGLHLNMYKSLTDLNDQKEVKEHLMKVITEIINMAMERGITLKRWCRMHNVFLEKDPNNPKLHRLRIIHIIEAYYNLATKILWARRLMKRAEQISDSNWGSRKSRSAQDAATVKSLHYGLAHLTLHKYATMENDAKSCYDRMFPNLFMLLSRSFGIKKSVCQSVGKTFERTRHHVTTKGGVSKRTFGYTKDKPIFGSWQGATKSVINWVLISSILQKIHQDTVAGATFESTDHIVKVS